MEYKSARFHFTLALLEKASVTCYSIFPITRDIIQSALLSVQLATVILGTKWYINYSENVELAHTATTPYRVRSRFMVSFYSPQITDHTHFSYIKCRCHRSDSLFVLEPAYGRSLQTSNPTLTRVTMSKKCQKSMEKGRFTERKFSLEQYRVVLFIFRLFRRTKVWLEFLIGTWL